MRRGLVVTFGILGWLLAIGGGLLAGIYSSDNAACGSSLGVTARSLSQTAQNSCVLYGTLWTLGIVFAVIGIVLLAGWVVLLVRAPPRAADPAKPKPGIYEIPGQGGRQGYWDGEAWRMP